MEVRQGPEKREIDRLPDDKQDGDIETDTLLCLSYGYGKIFVVPHEVVEGQMQGGECDCRFRGSPPA